MRAYQIPTAAPERSVETAQIAEIEQISNVRRLRTSARSRINVPAVVSNGEACFPVIVRNVSRRGAGVQTNGFHRVGEIIRLHLLDGRQMSAIVRWTRLGFAGLEFEKELLQNDALFGNNDELSRGQAEPSGDALPPTPRAAECSILQSLSKGARSRGARVIERIWSVEWARLARFRNRPESQELRMIEAACRKQGYAWLTEP